VVAAVEGFRSQGTTWEKDVNAESNT
jgi:hypothetical protein